MKAANRNLRGPLVVAALVAPPVVLWMLATPLSARVANQTAAFESLANVAALLGTATFAVNLAIGARLPFAERCFGPVDRMYRLHKTVGVTALVLIAAHALFISASYATISLSLGLRLFLPSAGWVVFTGVVALVCMTMAMALTLGARMRHETFVMVQRSFGPIFLLSVVHVAAQPGSRTSAPTLYLLALSVLATASFLYRSVLTRFAVRRFAYRLVTVDRLAHDAVELSLTPEGRQIRFRPGQFAFFTFHDRSVGSEPHPFSIASSPNEANLRIVVKALGDFTADLMLIRPGASVSIEGPYGSFSYLEVSNPQQIWIAGGVGITPFLSMARTLGLTRDQIDLYYCTEQADQAHFLGELFEIADRASQLRVVPVRAVSLGHLRAEDILGVTRDLVERDILVCGPPGMNHNLTRQFVELGLPEHQIHSEDFSFLRRGG